MPTTKPKPKKPTHGGARAGAGRPRSTGAGDRVWHLRPTDDDEARRVAAGEKPSDFLRRALGARYQLEDGAAVTNAIRGLLEDANSHRQLTPTEQDIARIVRGEASMQELAQMGRRSRAR